MAQELTKALLGGLESCGLLTSLDFPLIECLTLVFRRLWSIARPEMERRFR